MGELEDLRGGVHLLNGQHLRFAHDGGGNETHVHLAPCRKRRRVVLRAIKAPRVGHQAKRAEATGRGVSVVQVRQTEVVTGLVCDDTQVSNLRAFKGPHSRVDVVWQESNALLGDKGMLALSCFRVQVPLVRPDAVLGRSAIAIRLAVLGTVATVEDGEHVDLTVGGLAISTATDLVKLTEVVLVGVVHDLQCGDHIFVEVAVLAAVVRLNAREVNPWGHSGLDQQLAVRLFEKEVADRAGGCGAAFKCAVAVAVGVHAVHEHLKLSISWQGAVLVVREADAKNEVVEDGWLRTRALKRAAQSTSSVLGGSGGMAHGELLVATEAGSEPRSEFLDLAWVRAFFDRVVGGLEFTVGVHSGVHVRRSGFHGRWGGQHSVAGGHLFDTVVEWASDDTEFDTSSRERLGVGAHAKGSWRHGSRSHACKLDLHDGN
jgi:hypothetical protein